MRFLLLLLGAALFVSALTGGWTFAANNAVPVDLDLIGLQLQGVALWKALLGAVAGGAAVTAFFLSFGWMRSAMVGRRFRKMVTKLEKEVHELRSLPLVGSEPDGSPIDAAKSADTPASAQPAAETASSGKGLGGRLRFGSAAKKG